jgi:hypothetical protein
LFNVAGVGLCRDPKKRRRRPRHTVEVLMVGGNSPERPVRPVLGGVFITGTAVACVVEAPALRIVVVQVRVVSELVRDRRSGSYKTYWRIFLLVPSCCPGHSRGGSSGVEGGIINIASGV